MEGLLLIIVTAYFFFGLMAVVYGLQFGLIIAILAPAIWLAEKTGIAGIVRQWRQQSRPFSSTLTIIGYILGYVGVWFLAPWLFWVGVLGCLKWLGLR
jgi:hypothetical protein